MSKQHAPHTAHLVDHVTFWMPAFVPAIAVDLHELLQYGTVTSNTFGRKAGGIMEMTIDVSVVFIVGILRSEQCRTQGTREMFNMILLVCNGVNVIDQDGEFINILHAVM